MSRDREELEKEALESVPAEDYYELCDCLDTTSDEELMQIISDAEDKSPGPSPG